MASSNQRPPTGRPSREEPPRRSLRLRFRYDGDEIELIRARRVTMTPPPSERLGTMDERSGFRVELCTRRGRVLYRRSGTSPIERSVEAPSDDPDRPFQRTTVVEPSGEFEIVVPDLDDADRLDVLDDALPGPQAAKAARERATAAQPQPAGRIASIDLRTLPITPRRKR
jgi:hypothetical protein